MNIEWKPRWDDWHSSKARHENKLVCFGIIAGHLEATQQIRTPDGLAGEDTLASLGIALVNAYESDPYNDEPFDLVCEEALLKYFPVEEEK